MQTTTTPRTGKGPADATAIHRPKLQRVTMEGKLKNARSAKKIREWLCQTVEKIDPYRLDLSWVAIQFIGPCTHQPAKVCSGSVSAEL